MDNEKVSVELEAKTGGFKRNIKDAEQDVTALKVKALELKTALSQAKRELSAIASGTGKSGLGFQEVAGDVVRLQDELKDTNSQIKAMSNNTDDVGKKGSTAFSNLGKHLETSRRKMSKLILSLLSVRSAYSVLSRAAQSYLSADTQLSAQIKNAWFGLGAMLAPVLQAIANAFTNIVTQVNAFVRALTGVDYIARANAKALSTQAKATGAVASATKDATSSIDELNVINKESSSGGGAGAGVDVSQFKPSNIDTSWATKLGEKLKPVWEGLQKMWDWLKKNKETIEKVGLAIAAAFVVTQVVKFIDEIKNVGKALDIATGVLDVGNLKWWLFAGAIAAIVYLGGEVAKVWKDMSPIQKAISILGGLAIAATAAAIAIGAVQSAWSLGVAALAITAGIVAITAAIKSAESRAKALAADFSSGGGAGYGTAGGGGRGFAEGGIITKPSRILVGEKAREAVVPLTNQKAMTQLADEIGRYASGNGNAQPLDQKIELKVDGKTLAKVVNKVNYESGATLMKGAFAK